MIPMFTPAPLLDKDKLERECREIMSHCDQHVLKLYQTTTKNGVLRYQWLCSKCGWLSGALPFSSLDNGAMASAPTLDDARRKAILDSRAESARKHRISAHSAHSAAWWQWYNTYLKSQVWQKKSDAVLKRDSYLCQACYSTRATHVHHLTYARVGQEPLFDLVAVCSECHSQLHSDEYQVRLRQMALDINSAVLFDAAYDNPAKE